MKHVVKYALEMHAPTVVREQTVTQNDAIEFVVTLLKDGEPIDMSGVTPSLAVKRRDGVTTALPGTVSGNTVTFALGSTETAKPGPVYAAVQLYGADGRVSSLPFTFQVKADLTAAGTIPSEKEATLIEVVLQDGPGIIQRAETAAAVAERVAVENKTNWLDAVATVAERDTAYPNPLHGDTVRVTGTATVYRYEDGKGWVVTDQYQQSAVDALNQQLAEKASQIDLTKVENILADLMYTKTGRLYYPSVFTRALPFNLFRGNDGITHNMEFSTFTDSAPSVYLARMNSSDSNDGLTPERPVRSLRVALEKANALPGTTVNVVFMEKFMMQDVIFNSGTPFAMSKNINFISNLSGGSFVFTGNDPSSFTWTADGGAYKTTRSAVRQVADYEQRDENGLPALLTKVSTLAECQTTPGTYYTDGTAVWVNRVGGTAPDDGIALILPMDVSAVININANRLFVDNVHFWTFNNVQDLNGLRVNGVKDSQYWAINNSYRFSRSNGFMSNKVGQVYHFNSFAFDNGYDGFNYHGTLIENPYEFVFEYYCESARNGHVVENGTGNATTAHEGMTLLRVGSKGYDCNGPLLADVNGCLSINIECEMYDSTRAAGPTKASYYFDHTGAVKQGAAFLINCKGVTSNGTYSVNTDGNSPVYVINFEANNIPDTLALQTAPL